MKPATKTKVLHTENAMDYTGGFRALLDYIKYSSSDIESIVVLPKGSKCLTYLEKEGVKAYEVPFVEIRKNALALLKYLPCLFVNAWYVYKIAKKEKVNILHSNDLYNLSLYVVKYFYRYDRPLFTHLRLLPSSYPAILYNMYRMIHSRFSDVLIAVSYAVKKGYSGSDKIIVVYDISSNIEHHKSYKVSFDFQRKYNFLYLANYTLGKGQDLAIDAFKILYAENPNCTLTFAGGTLGNSNNVYFKKVLLNSVKEKAFFDAVSFEDFVEDVEYKMKSYDCILNFSLAESFSFTSFDALRFGVPLIVSDCGGPAELVLNQESGLIVKNGSVEEMASAMLRISTDLALNQKFSTNGKISMNHLMINNKRFPYLSELFISSNKKGS